MLNLDTHKIYMLQVMLPDSPPLESIIIPGNKLNEAVREYKELYPNYKKIVIYDADTKEAVSIIRP